MDFEEKLMPEQVLKMTKIKLQEFLLFPFTGKRRRQIL
jgi:hypothetical protein